VRLEIRVDGYSFVIDSTDPELLGKWMLEVFARVGPFTPGTYCQVQAFPSFVSDPSSPQGLRPDWIADTRIIGGVFQVKSPRELVEALAKQLDEAEGLDHGR
jgi:hypothetical protein